MYKTFLSAAFALCGLAGSVAADQAPFEDGWAIDQSASSLNFVSIKKGNVLELSKFATLNGTIAEDGNVSLTIPLDSVDTSVDLRNVRMRFLFFETFNFPDATITAQLTEEMLADLEVVGTKTITLPFTMTLRGITKEMHAEVLVSLISKNRVSVSSVTPIFIQVTDFNLSGGLAKLESAAEVKIVPATSITFNFAFDRNGTSGTAAAPLALARATTALEPEGPFTRAACEGRFEIFSRTGNIYFQNASADLTTESSALLREVATVVSKCPGMTFAVDGHTDSRGSDDYNLILSEQRANAVIDYFVNAGLPRARFVGTGYGETQPIASNATQQGRSQNRRISFSIASFDTADNN